MLIPENLLQKESDHIEGFAPEVAWVTKGGLETLQEPMCIRPTSETLFCDLWARTVQSYRDRSFVPENSYGRKDTPFMQLMKKQNREH